MSDSTRSPTPVPSLAALLGYAGLIPFVALTLLLGLRVGHSYGLAWGLALYAALIATFLGGLHWGLAAQRDEGARGFHYAWGVAPSLLAWCVLCLSMMHGLPLAVALLLLAVLLVACYAVDRMSYRAVNMQEWLPMRLRLTVVATLSCAAGAAALFARA